MTFVNYATWIWKYAKDKESNSNGYTQKEMAKILGWNRVRIAQYKALQDITFKAWEIIVTSFNNHVTQQENNHVTENVTNVTFSEGFLRGPFLTLKPRRQYELVFRLADPNDALNKKQFKTLAQAYAYQEAVFITTSPMRRNYGSPDSPTTMRRPLPKPRLWMTRR